MTVPVDYRWNDLFAHLRRVLDFYSIYDLRIVIYRGREEIQVDSSISFTVQQAFLEEGYHLRVYQPMRRGYEDIGVFIPLETSLPSDKLINLLHGNTNRFESLQLDQLISSFGPSAPLNHTFLEHSPQASLSSDTLDRLKRHADFTYEERLSRREIEEEVDLQLTLKREELSSFIGSDALRDLDRLFGQRCDDIVLRRCNKIGHYIDFHLDYSMKTMQVAVVDDSEYEGGRLAYVVKSENDGVSIEIPRRKKGSITIHDNGVIHGVTTLIGGVRYGLLVLDRGFTETK